MILTADGIGFDWWQYGFAFFGDLVLVSTWASGRK
jgi:hypothetical protein